MSITINFLPCIALLLFASGVAEAQLMNGNFETGDLTGWTVFDDTNGSAGNPTVVFADTSGTGVPSYSAQFQVGETKLYPDFGLGAGGGIFQNVTLGAGQLTICLEIAAATTVFPFTPNGDGGTFQLLLDDVVVDSHAFGSIGSYYTSVTNRYKWSYSRVITAGNHKIAIDIRRGGNASDSTPYQYLDNISLIVTNPPPPKLRPPSYFNFHGNQYFLLS
jgi:hypothetical protein